MSSSSFLTELFNPVRRSSEVHLCLVFWPIPLIHINNAVSYGFHCYPLVRFVLYFPLSETVIQWQTDVWTYTYLNLRLLGFILKPWIFFKVLS